MLKRSPNWSYEESEQLIVSVDLRKQILFSKGKEYRFALWCKHLP